MNRRSFLSMMGFVAPNVIVKPTYFFAPRDGWGIKLYSTIGAWADYPGPGAYGSYTIRYTASYSPEFIPTLIGKLPSQLNPNGGCNDV